MLFDIKNQNIWITGGASGIGKAISIGLLKHNSKVTIIDKKKPDLRIKKKYNFIKCDLSESEQIYEVLNNNVNNNNVPNGLVNCAGVTFSSSAVSYDYHSWNSTLNINLKSVFFLSQFVAKKMIKNKIKGSIVNFTSIGAEEGFANNPAYGASKGGLKVLTKSLAVEWGKYNIRVNNIVPGYTITPMNKKSWKDKDQKKIRSERTILNRWANPNEMLGPTIFLLSEASSYITGTDLLVDGGWTTKGI